MSTPSPHPDARRLADYRSGHLPVSEVLGVSDHLAACPACRARLPAAKPDATAGWQVDLPAILLEALPDYEEMAALLDGSLDAAQAAATHARLAASPAAAAAFADLQRFRDEVAALPPKWHGPEYFPGAANPAETAELPAVRKIVPFPRLGRASWIAAAAAVVLLSAGWWLAAGVHPAKTRFLWADADLSRLPDDLRRSVERAARTGTVDTPPTLAELSAPREILAGSPPPTTSLRLLAPVGVVVPEERPALQWTPVPEATGYVVYLADAEERTPALRQEVPAGVTAWTPPAALAGGTTYEWQVEARCGNESLARAPRPPEPEARFRVLDAPRAAELTEVERLYPQNALILGTAYARAGLMREAEQQFEALAQRYPESGAAKRLQQETRGKVAAEK